MFMKEKVSGDLIRIDDIAGMESPLEARVEGRRQTGEEEQDATSFEKTDLIFPSGEALPKCWLDAEYELP